MALDISTAVFSSYAYFAGLIGVKLLLMSGVTGLTRFRKKAFANPEDVKALVGKGKSVKLDDPDVERTRRAHLNDLENILPFLILGFIYCFTNPAAGTANLLFKSFTISRYIHTFVYAIYPVPQPARGTAWVVGYLINFYMAFKIITHFS